MFFLVGNELKAFEFIVPEFVATHQRYHELLKNADEIQELNIATM